MQKIVNLGSKITGWQSWGVSALCEKNILRKCLTILDDTAYILYLDDTECHNQIKSIKFAVLIVNNYLKHKHKGVL